MGWICCIDASAPLLPRPPPSRTRRLPVPHALDDRRKGSTGATGSCAGIVLHHWPPSTPLRNTP